MSSQTGLILGALFHQKAVLVTSGIEKPSEALGTRAKGI